MLQLGFDYIKSTTSDEWKSPYPGRLIVEKTDEYIAYESVSEAYAYIGYTTHFIDLTKYKTLELVGTVTKPIGYSGASVAIGFKNEDETNTDIWSQNVSSITEMDLPTSLDISSLNGNYALTFTPRGHTSIHVKMKITKCVLK